MPLEYYSFYVMSASLLCRCVVRRMKELNGVWGRKCGGMFVQYAAMHVRVPPLCVKYSLVASW